MSLTSTQNPQYYSGPMLELVNKLAAGSKTWQEGQFGRYTDSGVVPCLSAATSIQCQFATTQAASTTAGDAIKVWEIPSSQTKFIIAVSNGGNDAKANPTMVGGNFGIGVNSCVCTISRGADSASVEALHVFDILPRIEGFKNDTSDTIGYVVAGVVESFRTAEGAGV